MSHDARILIVEDEPSQRSLLKTLLEGRGFAVTTAGSVEEGKAALDDALPDVLLTDYHLDDGNGLELHASFKLSREGATLKLCDPEGVIVDEFSYGEQQPDGPEQQHPGRYESGEAIAAHGIASLTRSGLWSELVTGMTWANCACMPRT